ncbi:HAD-IB family hydrolase [Amnibacterium flavum]|uniref:HAD-IB family hydrolase n=1 Tax=Amnibacterium flavum TaxID=2173173 RepID=A0A2V1HXC5_9MICO|nr:HAD-IB family hydrolase [Amnibacterium flavum]PVZ95959.1 HAD-IB family hydrolase [Amnibacterium flavum]
MNPDLGKAHILLTGATGFVGQAVLERLLTDHPETTISVIVRAKGSTPAQARVDKLIRKAVFRPWRERVGDEEAARILAERVRVIEGDLDSVEQLPGDLDIVLHGASTVSFDPPIDKAFDTNVGGATGLYGALAASGSDPHVVHISTAYVNGARKGLVTENAVDHQVDWRLEHSIAQQARERVEFDSRQPETLRRFIHSARQQHGKVGPRAVAEAAETLRREFVDAELVDHGRSRAESLGWTDVYTLTKALAERVAEEQWAGAGHRLSVVRPSIIESAVSHPYPGWIDGFKVADPLILAYGRGQLPEFPGVPDSVLDVVPVDHVVNAILAVAASPEEPGRAQYFHVASGARNPLPFHRMYENVKEFFTANPIPAEGGPVEVPSWRFPGGRKLERELGQRVRRSRAAERVVTHLPATPLTRKWLDQIETGKHELELLRSYSDLYRAYVQTEIIFDVSRTHALHESLPDDLRDDRGFDVDTIDWEHYLQGVHFPSITSLTRAFADRGSASARTAKPLPQRSDVVAVFDLEGTVLEANLIEQYLMLRLADRAAVLWPREAARLLATFPKYVAAERRDRGEFIRTLLRLYKGMKVADIRRLVEGRVGRQLQARLLPDALARVAEHRKAGHRTVLVTGGIDLLTAPVAEYFDEVVAGRMHERDGVLTGYLDRPPLVDESRAAWLRHYADEHGVDLARSYGYGDSLADRSWLQLVGNPTAVNPDAALYRFARGKRWDVAEWTKSRSDSAPNHIDNLR